MWTRSQWVFSSLLYVLLMTWFHCDWQTTGSFWEIPARFPRWVCSRRKMLWLLQWRSVHNLLSSYKLHPIGDGGRSSRCWQTSTSARRGCEERGAGGSGTHQRICISEKRKDHQISGVSQHLDTWSDYRPWRLDLVSGPHSCLTWPTVVSLEDASSRAGRTPSHGCHTKIYAHFDFTCLTLG